MFQRLNWHFDLWKTEMKASNAGDRKMGKLIVFEKARLPVLGFDGIGNLNVCLVIGCDAGTCSFGSAGIFLATWVRDSSGETVWRSHLNVVCPSPTRTKNVRFNQEEASIVIPCKPLDWVFALLPLVQPGKSSLVRVACSFSKIERQVTEVGSVPTRCAGLEVVDEVIQHGSADVERRMSTCQSVQRLPAVC